MIFRRSIDALATRAIARYMAARWRHVSGRRGDPTPASPLQRPHFYLPGLTAKPWWDRETFPWIPRLEQHTDVLRRELHGLLAQGYLRPAPIETIEPRKRDLDQRLVLTGAWHLYRLYYNGVELLENCRRCPATSALFRTIGDQCGTVGFGVLEPGTHVAPHCGPTNVKLRCHLGLEVPPACGIRVGDDTRTWKDGECIAFDDSFEHEVWNRGTAPRYIFLIDAHHPELTARERHWVEDISHRIVTLAPKHMRRALEYEPRAAVTTI